MRRKTGPIAPRAHGNSNCIAGRLYLRARKGTRRWKSPPAAWTRMNCPRKPWNTAEFRAYFYWRSGRCHGSLGRLQLPVGLGVRLLRRAGVGRELGRPKGHGKRRWIAPFSSGVLLSSVSFYLNAYQIETYRGDNLSLENEARALLEERGLGSARAAAILCVSDFPGIE